LTAAADSGSKESFRPIAVLSAAMFCTAASMRVADPMLPRVALEFAVTAGAASVIAWAFTLPYGICQIGYGPLGDRYGKYRVVTVAMTLAAVAVMASALAGSLAMLAALRFASGIFAGAVIPMAIAYVGDVVPYERRQAVLARLISGQLVGIVSGLAVGGLVLDVAGWQAVLLIVGLAYALVAGALWIELRSPRVADARSASASMNPATVARSYRAIAAAPSARLLLAVVFCEGFLFFGSLTFFGAALRTAYGLDYTVIGLLLGMFGVGGLCYSLTARWSVPRLGERGLIRLGGTALLAGFLGLAWLPAWWGAIPAIGAIGFGLFMLHNTLQTRATQMAPEARGSALSLFVFFMFVGQSAGVAALGLLVDRIGYPPVFVASGVGLFLLGLVAAGSGRESA